MKESDEALKDGEKHSEITDSANDNSTSQKVPTPIKLDKSDSIIEPTDKVTAVVECLDVKSDAPQATKKEPSESSPIKHTENRKKHVKNDTAGKRKNPHEMATPKEAQKTSNCTFRDKDSKYKYGNYSRYYGYRNANMAEDDRVEHFKREWFEGKTCLDIGCNVGHLTLYIAKQYNPRSLLGVDIDSMLIKSAINNIRNYLPTKKAQAPLQSDFPISFAICHGPLAAPVLPDVEGKSFGFPYNVSFKTVSCFQSSEFLQHCSMPCGLSSFVKPFIWG